MELVSCHSSGAWNSGELPDFREISGPLAYFFFTMPGRPEENRKNPTPDRLNIK